MRKSALSCQEGVLVGGVARRMAAAVVVMVAGGGGGFGLGEGKQSMSDCES